MQYGLIYLWWDKKKNKYYLGCHWGTEHDGYVCSSRTMKAAYKKRPSDFKRRIINKIFTSREDMLNKEHDWLSLIKDYELGKKYYNRMNHHFNHWSASEDYRRLSIQEKISLKTKEAMNDPVVRKKYLDGLKTRTTPQTPEITEKRRQSIIKTLEQKFPLEKRRKRLPKDSEELKELHRKNTTKMWQDPEHRKNTGIKISESLKGKPGNRLGHKSSPEHIEKIRQANLGKKRSKETKAKCRESQKGKKWWTDGINEIRSTECPDGWKSGRNEEYKEMTKLRWQERKINNKSIINITD